MCYLSYYICSNCTVKNTCSIYTLQSMTRRHYTLYLIRGILIKLQNIECTSIRRWYIAYLILYSCSAQWRNLQIHSMLIEWCNPCLCIYLHKSTTQLYETLNELWNEYPIFLTGCAKYTLCYHYFSNRPPFIII